MTTDIVAIVLLSVAAVAAVVSLFASHQARKIMREMKRDRD